MQTDPRAVESLLAFWADVGVDLLYADAPVDRTAPPIPVPARPRPTVPVASRPAPVAQPRPISTPPQRNPEIAIRAAAEAIDLEALERAINVFEGCALKYAGARRAVFARGEPNAPVMIIGEAPGAEEDAQGKPFVGRAGRLMDRMLAAARLEGRVFIVNTVFWRPPGNRTPTAEEQAACAPFLERAIALVKPSFLLLVGKAAAGALLRRPEGILALRGRWFEWRSSDGALDIPALPTLHPAFLLRQPAAKQKSWEDLLMLTERLDRPARPG
jgi:DNA polymerase